MFKKTCYICGKKKDTLYEGKCKNCYKQEKPPIAQIKPINLKFCNFCKKIHYNNQLLTKEELEQKLPEIVKKNLTIEDNYKLEDIKIKNFEIEGEKVSFDIETNCKLVK
jgi:NMD protein affecting ribosome stability and mRNA decay